MVLMNVQYFVAIKKSQGFCYYILYVLQNLIHLIAYQLFFAKKLKSWNKVLDFLNFLTY